MSNATPERVRRTIVQDFESNTQITENTNHDQSVPATKEFLYPGDSEPFDPDEFNRECRQLNDFLDSEGLPRTHADRMQQLAEDRRATDLERYLATLYTSAAESPEVDSHTPDHYELACLHAIAADTATQAASFAYDPVYREKLAALSQIHFKQAEALLEAYSQKEAKVSSAQTDSSFTSYAKEHLPPKNELEGRIKEIRANLAAAAKNAAKYEGM